jgi:hypothetical protein
MAVHKPVYHAWERLGVRLWSRLIWLRTGKRRCLFSTGQ